MRRAPPVHHGLEAHRHRTHFQPQEPWMRPRALRPSPICSGNPPEPRPVPRRRISTVAALLLLTLFAVSAHAQTPADSARGINVDSGGRDQRGLAGERLLSAKASDVPNDNGKAIHLD